MNAIEQLELDAGDGLPAGFVDRWRDLGGPPVVGDVSISARGRWWLVVRVAGRRFALANKLSPAAAADQLFSELRRCGCHPSSNT